EAGKYMGIYSSRHHARKRRATASPEQLRSLPDAFARGDSGDEARRVVTGRWGHRRIATLHTRLPRTRLRHPLSAAASWWNSSSLGAVLRRPVTRPRG